MHPTPPHHPPPPWGSQLAQTYEHKKRLLHTELHVDALRPAPPLHPYSSPPSYGLLAVEQDAAGPRPQHATLETPGSANRAMGTSRKAHHQRSLLPAGRPSGLMLRLAEEP